MVILQLQRMFYGCYPSLSDFVRLLISPTFFSGMQSMACYLTGLPARYSGQVFCSIRFVILTV